MSYIDNIIEDLGEDFLEEFLQNTTVTLDELERYLMDLHLYDDEQRMSTILQLTQTVKRNCRVGFLDPLVAYVQSFEDLMTEVSAGRLPKTELLSELSLLVFDEIRASCQNVANEHSLNVELLGDLKDRLLRFIATPQQQYEQKLGELIGHFASRVNPDFCFSAIEVYRHDEAVTQSVSLEVVKDVPPENEIKSTTKVISPTQAADLSYFRDLSLGLDGRSRYWDGRTQKIKKTALLINQYLPEPVDEAQLTAAVYLHDLFMTLLDDGLLFKREKYGAIETMMVQQHPLQAYEFMKRIPGWQEAARIIYEHHERPDGKGYPNALKGDQISIGAKVLAVADAFYALTNERSDRMYKKSLLRSVSEINKYKGSQFDLIVINAFNKMLDDPENRSLMSEELGVGSSMVANQSAHNEEQIRSDDRLNKTAI